MKKTFMRKTLVSMLLALFTMMSFQAPALADIVSTEQLAMEQQIQIERNAVLSFFSRDDVKAQLVARGVDASDAQMRVDTMTASEISSLYEQIDTLPAGEGALGVVIAIIVILMLLDIAGVTDIFPAL